MHHDITLSIVTYNGRKIIEEALRSLLHHIPSSFNIQIIIVDNNSTDDTAKFLSEYALLHPIIKVIASPNNVGFGKGHNMAIRESQSSYHIICNPDIIFHKDVLTPLYHFMELNLDIGISSPKILNVDLTLQPLNKLYPTFFDLFLRRFTSQKCQSFFRKRMDHFSMLDKGYDSIIDVPSLTGAFMFCRTDLLKKVKGFDKRYFLYYEDFDLCRKIQNLGFRTVYYPFTDVVHMWERASYKKWKMTYIQIKSSLHYFNKWGWKFW